MVNIVVIGSINMDIVTNVERHPLIGETVKGLSTEYYPGGKGANQAISAYRSGGNVTIIGAIGEDVFSEKLLGNFRDIGLETYKIIQKNIQSGLAFITVNSKGDNSIILSEGANAALTIEDVEKQIPIILDADILILQNEIPWKTTKFVIEVAYEHGVKVLFNPAPAANIDKDILEKIDLLILNESEAQHLTGQEVIDYSTAKIAIKRLIDYGVKEVILTLGVNGTLYSDENGNYLYTPAFKVNTLDTTAAGDSFIGALAVEMLRNNSMEDCLKFATAAAAITTTKKGAQSSIPLRLEIESFLNIKQEIYENLKEG